MASQDSASGSMPDGWVRKVTQGHMIVMLLHHIFMYYVSKLSLEDSSSNWIIPLEHSNVSVRICSYGKEMIDDVADRFGELLRYMLLREDSGYIFSHG